MSWNGARTGSHDAQAYYTSPILANSIVNLVKKFRGPYAELGVGDGSLYKRLPEPKEGVELRTLSPKLRGVTYGIDALKWRPSKAVGVIVMNPPFAHQSDFFNHAASLSDVIIWIAGLNIRLWTNEDILDCRMHLENEWLVPPEWSSFSSENGPVNIRSVVQIWRKKQQPRVLWNLRSTLKPCKNQQYPPANAIVVKRVGSAKDVGKTVSLRDCKFLKRSGKVLKTEHGTLQAGWGTAIAFDNVPKLYELLKKRFEKGVFSYLLYHRIYSYSLVSLSVPLLSAILSHNWRRLIRNIEYLDGLRRSSHQW